MRIFAARIALSNAVQDSLEGEAGAFAAAIMSGDRSGMSQDTLAALRGANLAHLLAISGLHMGLLTAFVFGLVRYGLVLIPGVGLRLPVKKIGAVFALVVGAFYLALSGGNVATGRAYIMVAMMFLAVLLGRRALTLRAVAMAAIIVLIFQPDALPGPGFQMSFSATTALVVMFGVMKKVDLPRLPKWSKPILSVVMSSFFAGIATAPFAAAHFNQIVHYGLIANLLSVPLMGIIIMPAAVLAVCLAPIGLWDVRLWIMDHGSRIKVDTIGRPCSDRTRGCGGACHCPSCGRSPVVGYRILVAGPVARADPVYRVGWNNRSIRTLDDVHQTGNPC